MSNALYPDQLRGLTFTVMKTPEFSTLIEPGPNAIDLRLPQTRNPIWHFTLIYDYLYGNNRSPNNTRPYGPYSDLSYLQGFYLARKGKFDDFLLNDPKDNTAAGMLLGGWQAVASYGFNAVVIDPQGHAQLSLLGGVSGALAPVWNDSGGTTTDGTVTWADQGSWPFGFPNAPCVLQVLGDGVGNYYSPIQRVLGGVVYEDITDLNGAITVYADGVLQAAGTNYTLLGPGLWLNDVLYAGMYLKWAAQPIQPVSATFQFYFRVRFEMDMQDFERTMDELYTIGGSLSKQGSGSLRLITARPNAPSAPLPPVPPPPPPPPPITGAVLNVVSAYIEVTNPDFQPLALLGTASPFNFPSFVGTSFWSLRTDTATITVPPAPTTIAGYSGIVVTFQLEETLGGAGAGPGLVRWLIQDVNIVVTFADASTQTIRPVSTNFTLGTDGGDVLNASNLTDSNPTTGATLESRSGGPLSTNSVFTVTF